ARDARRPWPSPSESARPAEKPRGRSSAGCELLPAPAQEQGCIGHRLRFPESRVARRCNPTGPAAIPHARDKYPDAALPSGQATETATAAPDPAEEHVCRADAARVRGGCAAKLRTTRAENRWRGW